MQRKIEKLEGTFSGVQILTNKSVCTYNRAGLENGFLLEIYSIRDQFVERPIQQVYMTVCNPGEKKGMHAHREKEDNFTCVSGTCEIVLHKDGRFVTIPIGEGSYRTVKIPPGIDHGIKCIGDSPAFVVNCTYPAYDPENPDQTEPDIGEW